MLVSLHSNIVRIIGMASSLFLSFGNLHLYPGACPPRLSHPMTILCFSNRRERGKEPYGKWISVGVKGPINNPGIEKRFSRPGVGKTTNY